MNHNNPNPYRLIVQSFGNIFRFRVSKACGLRKKLVTLIDTSE